MSTDGMRVKESGEVLVVVDDPASQRLVSLILELEGYATIRHQRPETVAIDGNKPLAAILDLSDFDDGWQALAADLAQRGVPFIIIGDGDEDDLQREVTEMGAAAFVRKPFDPNNLIAGLLQVLPQDVNLAGTRVVI